MIHDAQVEVTCDSDTCEESAFIDLEYTFDCYCGNSGQYDASDGKIEDSLTDQEWVVDEGKHYCCEACRIV